MRVVSIFLLVTLFIALSVPLYICAELTYTIIIKAVDINNNPIPDAIVRITTQYGPADFRSQFGNTNESGIVVFDNITAVNAKVEIRVTYKGVVVADVTYDLVNQTNSFVVTCDVFDLTVVIKDFKNESVPSADVELSWTTDIPYLYTQTTNSKGIAIFSQIPSSINGSLTVSFLGVLLYSQSHKISLANSQITIYIPIYDLRIIVVDRSENPIPNAYVTITCPEAGWSDQRITDSNGQVLFSNLPKATYEIELSYMHRTATETLLLDSDLNRTYQLDVVIETTTPSPTVTITTITTTPPTTTSPSSTGSTTTTSPPPTTPSPTGTSPSPTPTTTTTESPMTTTTSQLPPKPPKEEEEFPLTGLLIILGVMVYSFGISWVILKKG